MKIVKVEGYTVPPRWYFVKIITDEGICGWGEPVIEGKAYTVAAAVNELSDCLIGTDPMRIEDHFQKMYRGGFYRGGPVLMSAIAGLEQALWDIKGKYYQAPAYDLMGGACRDRIRVYSWIGGDRPDDVAHEALERKKAGFTAIKMNATEELHYVDSYAKIDAVVARAMAVREACGRDFGIAIDFHGRVHKPMAKVLARALEEARPMFIEEPVLPENNEALTELSRHTSIPIAVGERMFSRWDYKPLFEQRVADIIQPDLSHAGGLLEVRKIAAMAEAYDVAVAPHCPLGPIALAACLQLDATCPNAFIQEQSLGIHYNQGSDLLDYLADPKIFAYQEGFVTLPTAPGLGIEINEEKVKEMAAKGHRWRNPIWRNEDGTVAEW